MAVSSRCSGSGCLTNLTVPEQVPACLLIVRNSTDTNYYQRLQPYPRVLLRRSACRFKDYDDLPIAWGVVVFCIAKHNLRYVFCEPHPSSERCGAHNMFSKLSHTATRYAQPGPRSTDSLSCSVAQ